MKSISYGSSVIFHFLQGSGFCWHTQVPTLNVNNVSPTWKSVWLPYWNHWR